MFFGTLLILIVSCNPTKHAQKKLNRIIVKHPELFQQTTKTDTFYQTDTLTITTAAAQDSSIFTWDEMQWLDADTLIKEYKLESEKFETILWTLPSDTITRWKIKTLVYPDTIKFTNTDTIYHTIEKPQFITNTTNNIPKVVWIFIIVLILLLTILYAKNRELVNEQLKIINNKHL